MPSIPDASITNAELIVQGTYAAAGSDVKKIAAVFHYKRSATSGVLSKTALKNIFVSSVWDDFLAAVSDRYTGTIIRVRWLDDALDPYQDFAEVNPGLIATDSLPSNDTVFMLLRTGLRGRSYQGKKHFVGVSEAQTTGDVLTGAGLALWQALRDAVAANIVDANGQTWQPSVYSRLLSLPTVNPTTIVNTVVTSVALNKRVGNMKRRVVASVY